MTTAEAATEHIKEAPRVSWGADGPHSVTVALCLTDAFEKARNAYPDQMRQAMDLVSERDLGEIVAKLALQGTCIAAGPHVDRAAMEAELPMADQSPFHYDIDMKVTSPTLIRTRISSAGFQAAYLSQELHDHARGALGRVFAQILRADAQNERLAGQTTAIALEMQAEAFDPKQN